MSIKTLVAKSKFFCKKNSPAILLGVGIAAEVAAIVFAAKGAVKANDAIGCAKLDLEDLDDREACEEYFDYINSQRILKGLDPVDISDEKTIKKERRAIKRKTTMSVVRAFAPAIVLTGVSVFCRVEQYRVLNKRLIACTIAYEALDQAYKRLDQTFSDYRERVRTKYGELEDNKLYWGEEICPDGENLKVKTVDENGNEVEELVPVKNAEKNLPFYSIYSKAYKNQSKAPGMDVMHIKAIQNWANDRLSANGYVLLSEVYDAFEFPIDSQCVGIGWISKEHLIPGDDGDGYIDFGVLGDANLARNPDARDWAEGKINSVILDFNVDGPIYNRLDAINKVEERNNELYMTDRAAYYRDKPTPYHV